MEIIEILTDLKHQQRLSPGKIPGLYKREYPDKLYEDIIMMIEDLIERRSNI